MKLKERIKKEGAAGYLLRGFSEYPFRFYFSFFCCAVASRGQERTGNFTFGDRANILVQCYVAPYTALHTRERALPGFLNEPSHSTDAGFVPVSHCL
jgi:hypothetical protein